MKESELIEKWEQSGLLETVPQEMKFLYSKNLETAQRFMEVRNGNDQVETLIYPIVFRITKKDKSMNVIQTIQDFIQKFETNKFDIYKDYIDNYDNYEKDGELEFVENFIKNYVKNKLN
jgi:hypothetical protein